MNRRRVTAAAFLVATGAVAWLAAQEPPPARPSGADIILTNGKVVTVDDRFSIAQAVAIEGDRILRVGSDSEIIRLSSPSTRRIDLRGRTVIPGLIDNHMHLVRAAATWDKEVRWDGVGTRKQALELLRARVKTTPAGEWIYNLGGWAVDQFADDSRPLTRDELDRVAPVNPVLLQASYYASYLNSRAAGGARDQREEPRVGAAGFVRPADRRDRGSRDPRSCRAAARGHRGSARGQHPPDDSRPEQGPA